LARLRVKPERRPCEAFDEATLCFAKNSGIKKAELPIIQETDIGKAEGKARKQHVF